MRANHPIMKELIKTVLYNPEKLRAVIGTFEDPKYAIRLLHKLVPYRTGIEIDCVGFHHSLLTQLEKIRKYNRNQAKANIELVGEGDCSRKIGDSNWNRGFEYKLSIFNFRGLTSLKKVLDILAKSNQTRLNEVGGLHIHIDLGMTASEAQTNNIRDKVLKYYNYFRNKVFTQSIKSEYKEYNKRDKVNYSSSSNIAIVRHLKTIEYRMGEPTFNYTRIVRQILCCQQLNYSVRKKVPFDKELTDMILYN